MGGGEKDKATVMTGRCGYWRKYDGSGRKAKRGEFFQLDINHAHKACLSILNRNGQSLQCKDIAPHPFCHKVNDAYLYC